MGNEAVVRVFWVLIAMSLLSHVALAPLGLGPSTIVLYCTVICSNLQFTYNQ